MEQEIETVESKEALLARLQAEHHQLDEQLERLEHQHSWSPEEEAEIRRLKKLKLQKKDEIFRLQHTA